MDDRQELEARILDLEAAQLSSRRRVRRLTATNVVLAVVVLAFGGTSAAYALAAANSVNSAAIIDRTISTRDVKVGAFAGQTILDNSMTTKDINESTLVLTCPSAAPNRVGDTCYTGEKPATNWFNAIQACKVLKLRLPTTSETYNVTRSMSSAELWTDTYYFSHLNSGTQSSTVIGSGSTDSQESVSSSHAYRCVTTVGARP